VILYIAGPMTGLPDYNYPAFHAAEQRLIVAGFTVLNPAHHQCEAQTPTWHDWMRLGLRAVTNADGIALLPGWQRSRGTRAELAAAEAIGIAVKPVDEWVALGAAAVSS
jgi:Domain of unknown function (DUF4406)